MGGGKGPRGSSHQALLTAGSEHEVVDVRLPKGAFELS